MILKATPELFSRWQNQLEELLEDSVQHGASVGFLLPLGQGEVAQYWEAVKRSLKIRVLLLSVEEGLLQGSVQLEMAVKANGLHRAEVQKLLVHSRARGRGLARQLMEALETEALAAGRTLLVLDTRQGDVASSLYESMSYKCVGVIPGYVQSGSGQLEGTVIFYKNLG